MINSFRENRAVVLASGGLDSIVSMARASSELDVRLVLFCNYGQAALDNERGAVLGAVNFYGLPFLEVDVSWLGGLAPKGMVGGNGPLSSLEDVWVPNRNGVLLNVAAAYAEDYNCGIIITGFNREEAVEFPDNSREFVDAAEKCFDFSTRRGLKVRSYTLDMTKREILLEGIRLKAPLSVMWSCYRGGAVMCGECPSCRKLRTALDAVPEANRPVLEFEV